VLQPLAGFARPFIAIFYKGDKVACPVCGGRFRKFLPYGYNAVREGALCPGCMSLERHRLMWIYLISETNIFESALRLLHIAPERCFIKYFEKALGANYITADLESPLAKMKMSIEDIPLEDSSIDVIFCNHVLEHIGDDRKALAEMYRVMKHGGWGIILAPVNEARETTYEDPAITTPKEREKAFGQYDHLREYGADYPDRLAEAGFSVEALKYYVFFGADEYRRFGLGNDTLYIVKK
jgi:SAM-dependent methyltransferase